MLFKLDIRPGHHGKGQLTTSVVVAYRKEQPEESLHRAQKNDATAAVRGIIGVEIVPRRGVRVSVTNSRKRRPRQSERVAIHRHRVCPELLAANYNTLGSHRSGREVQGRKEHADHDKDGEEAQEHNPESRLERPVEVHPDEAVRAVAVRVDIILAADLYAERAEEPHPPVIAPCFDLLDLELLPHLRITRQVESARQVDFTECR